jgi:uncharacterized HAD superfamily protein
MRIGVDLDGCLGEFVDPYLDHHNKIHGTSFIREDVTSHDPWEYLGITRDEFKDELFEFFGTNSFKELPVVWGSRDVIRELSMDNDLFVVTFRPDFIAGITKRWVGHHYFDRFKDVIVTGEYNRGREEPKSKKEICWDYRLDVIIEDSLENAVDCASGGIRAVLLNYRWNQNGSLPDKVNRVDCWDGVYGVVNGGGVE